MSIADEARVIQCLAILEQAQGMINDAASRLCPVPGFADEWSSLSEPYESIKCAWGRIDTRWMRLRRKECLAELPNKREATT